MEPIAIRYKDGFKIEERSKLFPLLSDISDTIGVISEHRKLNGTNKYLRYGLQKIKGEYYFFDVRNTVNQNIKDDYYSEYICPYCKEKMFIVSSFNRGESIVPIHLKHYKKTHKDCIFRTDSRSLKLREEYYNSEEFISREMLDSVYNKLKNNKLNIRIPKEYVALKNVKTKEVRIEVKHKIETVIRVEKGEDRFKDIVQPYIPHLIFYTEEGNEVYCEITVRQSKSISKYYDIWKANNKTILEIKKVDDLSLFPKKFLFEGDLSLTYLYDPILDKAKRHKLLAAKKLADQRRKEIKENMPKRKVPKRVRRALKNEVSNLVNSYLKELVNENEINIHSNGDIFRKNGNKIDFKTIMIEKGDVVTGMSVPEIAIDLIIRNGYRIK